MLLRIIKKCGETAGKRRRLFQDGPVMRENLSEKVTLSGDPNE